MITNYGLNENIGLLSYEKSRHHNIGQNKLADLDFSDIIKVTDEIYSWTKSPIININKDKIEYLILSSSGRNTIIDDKL